MTGRRSSAERLAVEPRYRHLEFDMHYSDFPTRLSSEGALVVQIPYEASGIDLIERLDGIVISGGQDVHPETLGIDAAPTDPDSDQRRDAYEIDRHPLPGRKHPGRGQAALSREHAPRAIHRRIGLGAVASGSISNGTRASTGASRYR